MAQMGTGRLGYKCLENSITGYLCMLDHYLNWGRSLHERGGAALRVSVQWALQRRRVKRSCGSADALCTYHKWGGAGAGDFLLLIGTRSRWADELVLDWKYSWIPRVLSEHKWVWPLRFLCLWDSSSLKINSRELHTLVVCRYNPGDTY